MAWGCQRPGPFPAPHSLLSHQTTQNAHRAGMAMLLGGWVTRGKCQLGTQPQFLSTSHRGPTNGPLASCKVSATPTANLTLLLLFLVPMQLSHTSLSWLVWPSLLGFLGQNSDLQVRLLQLSPKLPAKPVSLSACRQPLDRRGKGH